jgi:hypothetical protein
MNALSLLKLAGIGLGVGKLVQLGIKSSGMLQGVMKMAESSIMLLLKPIADFIGLMLRPIMVVILTQGIIPFYKHVMPWVREWGPKVGQVLVMLPSIISTAISETGKFFANVGGSISAGFSLAGKGLQEAWDLFIAGLTNTFVRFPGLLWGVFVLGAETLWQRLTLLPGFFFGIFELVANDLWTWISGVPGMIVAVFSELADALAKALASIPQMIKDAITSMIPNLGSGPTANTGASRTAARTFVSGLAATVQ